MIRLILGLALGGGLGALAGNAALQQLFADVSLQDVWERLDDRGPVFLAVAVLPLLFLVLRGIIGHLIAMALVAGGVSLALKYGLQDGATWSQALALSAAYAIVSVLVYRLLVSRALG